MRKVFFFVTLLLCNTLIAQLPSNVPSAGLIGYWPYSGNAQDQSVNNNHGNVDGATLVPDRFGNLNSAYSFNGTSNSIIVPYDVTQHLISGFTFSGWIKNDLTQSDFQSIFLRQGGEGTRWDKTWLPIHHTGDGTTNIRVYNEHSYYTSVSLGRSDADWFHLVVTIEGSTATVFKNGVKMGSGNIGFPLTYTPASMKFGMAGSGNQLYYYKGSLDDIGIWNRALSEEEVLSLFNPAEPECPAPVAVSIPHVKALNYGGVDFNTVYPAYTPAASVTLTAQVEGNKEDYEYQWSNGATSSSITVSPTENTEYSVAVTKKANGCMGTASIDIQVKEVSCDNGKIVVCHQTGSAGNPSNTLCIASTAVAAHLLQGGSLGRCGITSKETLSSVSVKAFPNPTQSYFNIVLNSDDKINVIHVRVSNDAGRIMEVRSGLSPNSSLQIGNNYKPGTYIVEVIQGGQNKQIKLIKTVR